MRTWLLLPVVAAFWITESVLVRNITLFAGAADILLLGVVAWAVQPPVGGSLWVWAALAALLAEAGSAMPTGVYLALYLGAAALTWTLRRRIWQNRLLLYLLVVFAISLLGGLGMYLVLWVLQGAQGDLAQALVLVVIPSTFLNILWALPVYFVLRELTFWVYADEELEP